MESPTLRIRLLGALDLRYGETPLLPLESARVESLLAYLLLHRDTPQPRQHLAYLLWPDSTESQARTNLRHLLHTLRHALPDPDRFLDVTPRTLKWRADTPTWLDVAAFTDAIARAERETGDGALTALREAVDLYAGDLLDGCYDEWLLGERERLRARYLDALARLMASLGDRGDHAEAIRYAEHLLRHDPLREESYRLLMRLHDARGDRARALHVYHVCAATLERELGVAPSAATREVYEALLPATGQPAVAERQGERLGGPPLVGRTPEWARLVALWRATERGRAQFVLVSGEPGIGKTRLVEEFRAWCVHRGVATAEARSYPAEGALAYAPIVSWLRADDVKARIRRLDRALLTELARLLPELLAELPGLPRPQPLPESDHRQRLFDAVARAILAPAAPLLLVADDLHWGDRETLQCLHYLLRVDPEARLLVVATARREELDLDHPLNDLVAGLHAFDRCTEIPLDRFTRAETAALAERITGRPVVGPDVDRLYGETEGSPLFVVETLRAGWRSGGDECGRLSPKVQAAIDARLAQLSAPARDLVGLAATIGREFSADVLADAGETDPDILVRALDELWRRRIIREQGADAYDFSHDKIREVAYLGLSPARRRFAHARVARALERRHARDPGPVSGQLAAHHERAGALDQAVAWYERAADVAQQMYANVEAIRLLDRALDLLRSPPATPERQARELAILSALLTPLAWVEGFGSERVAAMHRRALDLARALGVEPEPLLLRSLAFASLARRDFTGARAFADQLHARGERDTDDMLLVEGNYMLGIAAFWQGEFATAQRHFEIAVDRYRPEHRRAHVLRYGLDPKVVCQSRLGNTLWFLGRPQAGTRARDEALALADEIRHPFSRATALVFAATLSLDMRDSVGVRAYTAMLTAEHGIHGTRQTRVAAEEFAGYLDVLDGRKEAGIARLQRALDDTRQADHAPGHRTHTVRVLLEACAAAGDARTGLATADWELGLGDAHHIWEAETRRRRAEFLAVLGAPAEEVEAEFERALAVAHVQEAKMLELRAATALLRYRLECGGRAASQARDRLAAIVAVLPERPDIPDLREVADLLDRR
ncbi:MAG TPA: AAA family ATPase [Thermomicrobiales bacterium]